MAQDLVMMNSCSSKPMTAVTRQEATAKIEAKIEELHGLLEVNPDRQTQYFVRRDRAVSIIERRALSAVRDRLQRELEPCDNRDHVDVVFTRLLKGFELGRGISEPDRQMLVGEFIASVKGLPLSAIHAAADRFRSGLTLLPWKKDFRPTSAQFASEARAGLIPTRTKLLHVERVLNATVYDPPGAPAPERDQAAVAEAMETFKTGRRIPGDPPQPQPLEVEVVTARDQALREQAASLARNAASGGLAALMARLDAKGVPPAPTHL